jgi:uncharacterized protein (TIGR02145 family)
MARITDSRRIFTDYQIKSELGCGGMATVHLAHHNKFDTAVAIKVLNKEFIHNENIRKRFLAEARNMFRMSHSNIIKVSDLIDEGDVVAFVMEYVEGETLKEYLDRIGKLGDDEIKRIFTQMLEAVGYVHDQHLVHRDIKPSNFMITPSGKIKLMDFGIAKNEDASSAEYTQTGTGVQMGTPMYMSPEQITETKSVTAQSDIYSLGVVLWQMVMGKKPYDVSTLSNFQLLTMIVNNGLSKTNGIWDSIIEKATHKDPLQRFESCIKFISALEMLTISETAVNNMLSKRSQVTGTEETVINLPEQKSTGSPIVGTEETNIHIPQHKLGEFPSVKIGSQIWMTENLNIDRFRNGDLIPEVNSAEEWRKAGENKQPAWCYYDNDPKNEEKYGKLYNWYAVNDLRGLAPEGWHIPSLSEWGKLATYLGNNNVEEKMKSISGWLKNGNGNNKSGFSGLPGGSRSIFGAFYNIAYHGCWWSSDESLNSGSSWNFNLYSTGSHSRLDFSNKGTGGAIRCIMY